MCSLININGNNSPINIKNLESEGDGTLPQSDNYLVIQFNEAVKHIGNFISNYKDQIAYLVNGDSIITDLDEEFILDAKNKLEIHFKEAITNMKNFFNTDIPGNDIFKKMISLDFSHFNTSLVTDMSYMLKGCDSLQRLDLSNVDISSLKKTTGMLSQSSSLENVIISLEFSKINKEFIKNMIDYLKNLIYTAIYSVKDIIDLLKNKTDLIVCESEGDIFTNETSIYQCCKVANTSIIDCKDVLTSTLIFKVNITITRPNIPEIQTSFPEFLTTIPEI